MKTTIKTTKPVVTIYFLFWWNLINDGGRTEKNAFFYNIWKKGQNQGFGP